MLNTLEYDGDNYYTYRVNRGSLEHYFVVHMDELAISSVDKQLTVELLPTSQGYLDVYQDDELVMTSDELITFQKFSNLYS